MHKGLKGFKGDRNPNYKSNYKLFEKKELILIPVSSKSVKNGDVVGLPIIIWKAQGVPQ